MRLRVPPLRMKDYLSAEMRVKAPPLRMKDYLSAEMRVRAPPLRMKDYLSAEMRVRAPPLRMNDCRCASSFTIRMSSNKKSKTKDIYYIKIDFITSNKI